MRSDPWVPDASSRRTSGPGLRARVGGRAPHRRAPEPKSRRATAAPGSPRGRYPPRRGAGLTVSGTDGRPYGQATGPRLKRASGSLFSGLQFFRLNRTSERESNPRPDAIKAPALPIELSSFVQSTGIEPVPRGLAPRSALELRPRSPSGGTRDAQSAPRRPGFASPDPKPSEGAGLWGKTIPCARWKIRAEVAPARIYQDLWHAGHKMRARRLHPNGALACSMGGDDRRVGRT